MKHQVNLLSPIDTSASDLPIILCGNYLKLLHSFLKTIQHVGMGYLPKKCLQKRRREIE